MKHRLLAFLLFYGFFLGLFWQFPEAGSLPGKVDTWFFLNAFNTIQNSLGSFFSNAELGNALFPENNVFAFGNYSFGQALFFLPFKFMGFDEIQSYYLFFSLMFALNSFSIYLIASLFKLKRLFAWIAGLLFSCSNFVFGNMDNPDALFLSIGIIGLYFFIKLFTNPTWGRTILAYSFLALEVYFSSYGFLFLCLVALIYGLTHLSSLISFNTFRRHLLGIVILLLMVSPYLYIYVYNSKLATAFNPGDLLALKNVGLNLVDLNRPLRYNMIYNSIEPESYNWLYKTKSAFTGITLMLLALIGLFVYNKENRKFFIILWLTFFLLAIGPFLPFENSSLKTPLYFLYDLTGFHELFRIHIRAYLICVLVMSITTAFALQYIVHQQNRLWLVIALVCVILIENIPYQFEKYPSEQLMSESIVPIKLHSNDVVLHLPSSFYSELVESFTPVCKGIPEDYEFEFVREYLYMYAQTKHKANTINGFSGFIPQSRMKNQELIHEMLEKNTLDKLISNNHISKIILNLNWFNDCRKEETIKYISNHPLLELEKEANHQLVFKVIV